MRRTLTVAGIAVLSVTGLAGPASAAPGAGITLDEGVVVNEIGASMGPSVDHNFAGGFIQLENVMDEPVAISNWNLTVCSTTGTFATLEINNNVVLQPDQKYLIADLNYNAPTGPAQNQSFGAGEILEQAGGGVEMVNNDATPVLQDELKYGNPASTCEAFPDVGVTPA